DLDGLAGPEIDSILRRRVNSVSWQISIRPDRGHVFHLADMSAIVCRRHALSASEDAVDERRQGRAPRKDEQTAQRQQDADDREQPPVLVLLEKHPDFSEQFQAPHYRVSLSILSLLALAQAGSGGPWAARNCV